MPSTARRKKSDREELPYYTRASAALLAEVAFDAKSARVFAAEIAEWAAMFEHCESRFQALYNWRVSVWTTWAQIARYMAPWRFYAFIQSNLYNQGLRNDFAIVDRTATLAGEVTAAGLMSGLTDPDSPWLHLGPAIPGFELDKAGQMWFDDLTERLRYIYANCNFYEAQAQHYSDLTFFGTSPVIDYESRDTILQCRVPCAGEYLLGTGFDNSDEVFYEEIRQTVNQTVNMFGPENCPEEILKLWRQKGGALQTEHVIGHAIEPNFAIEGMGGEASGVVPGGFPWREIYWLRGKKDSRPLCTTGFSDQPFAVSRWDTQGNEAYGRGVGEKMLGDSIQLQLETRQKAESIEKVNRPPMGADVSLQNQPKSINPGNITYFNTGADGAKKFFPLYEVRPDIPAISADLTLIQERLRKTAYNDVFMPVSDLRQKMTGEVTATEIDQIKQERMLTLGPMIGRVYGSLRGRVRRHLGIMKRLGIVPPKPRSLQGVPLKIEFVSMLTAAQKAASTAAIARSAEFIGKMASVYPQARFNLDPDSAVREFNEGVGAPATILRAPADVKKLTQAEQNDIKMQKLMAMTKEGAMAAGVLGKSSIAPDTALGAMTGGGGNPVQ